jgi:uncharacterized Fe-S cluster protein YjdI
MKTYTNTSGTLTVSFDKDKCIHCANCVNSLPDVFELGHKPWIKMDGASEEQITEVVGQCPSGALMVVTK